MIVGFDREINYYKIQYATLCIRENENCEFIATNRDAVTHLTDAQEWAGNGSMVGAIAGSAAREPTTVGKPSTFMLDDIADQFQIDKSEICMVGDRLDTDILSQSQKLKLYALFRQTQQPAPAGHCSSLKAEAGGAVFAVLVACTFPINVLID